MSRPRTDLSVDINDVKPFVQFLGGIAFVEAVYINGSRSPKSKRPPREDSDWDFICVVSTTSPVKMRCARVSHGIHADAIYIQSQQLAHYSKAVMVWPNDVEGIFENG